MGSDESTPIVATSTAQTGKSPIDYFSWGHIDLGIGGFLLLSLINALPSYFEDKLIYFIPYWMMLALVIVVAIVWEILENTLFVTIGIKFEVRRDSFKNALWDIIFGITGGLATWILKGILVNIYGVENNNIPQYIIYYYIVGAISFIIFLVCFLIGRAITKD
ncbi:MAG: hypothetical protein ACFFG0_36535 [Candidatus Thorarchaeota archaeon]